MENWNSATIGILKTCITCLNSANETTLLTTYKKQRLFPTEMRKTVETQHFCERMKLHLLEFQGLGFSFF